MSVDPMELQTGSPNGGPSGRPSGGRSGSPSGGRSGGPSGGPSGGLDPTAAELYRRVMRILEEGGVRFLVGGAYAYAHYTGIVRHTKDFDIFIHPRDLRQAMGLMEAAGYPTELKFPHWLAKAHHGEYFVDLIFSSGNGVARVDNLWFVHAPEAEVLGVRARLVPVEEMIWSKGFIMERERYDGADVAHLLHSAAENLDWERLLERFGRHWRVLLAHLILFGYIYPAESGRIPRHVMQTLCSRLGVELHHPDQDDPHCRGTVLSRQQYLPDIERAGYRDARLPPDGRLTPEEIEIWTAGIKEDGGPAASQAAPAAAGKELGDE